MTDPSTAAHSAAVYGKDQIALKKAREALEAYRLPSGHFSGCLRNYEGRCERVCENARAAIEAIEERLLDG